MGDTASSYATASPLVAITASGFGPLAHRRAGSAGRDLHRLRTSTDGVIMTIETSGRIAQQLLAVLAASGNRLTGTELAFQTAGAAPGVIDEALDRMEATDLVERTTDGGVTASTLLLPVLQPLGNSLADHNAITTDALAQMCRALGIKAPARKQERIDAIAALFADPAGTARVRADLSQDACELLERIADRAGAGSVSPEAVGLHRHTLVGAAPARYSFQRGPQRREVLPLYELTSRGIVGIAEWQYELWVWTEAWPVVGRAFYTDWSSVERPPLGPAEASPPTLPRLLAIVDRALTTWQSTPARVLKNDDVAARQAGGEVAGQVARRRRADPRPRHPAGDLDRAGVAQRAVGERARQAASRRTGMDPGPGGVRRLDPPPAMAALDAAVQRMDAADGRGR